MQIEKIVERWFRMTDEVWERHANPLSVWTRYLSLPVLALSIWSRVWIGQWAWIPALLSLVWIWLNPRVFRKPCSTERWESKSVLGERLWLARERTPVAIWHDGAISAANSIAAVGAVLTVYGLIHLDAYHVVYGVALTLIGKTWFLDRMVWLYRDSMRSR